MNRIQEIWPEFVPDESYAKDYVFHDVMESPFLIQGLELNAEKSYCRLPLGLGATVSEGVDGLAWHTAGAVVRFKTDAPSLCVAGALGDMGLMNHMTVCGQSGCELYEEREDGTYRQIGVIRPEIRADLAGIKPFFQFKHMLPGQGMRGYILYMPLYNGLQKLLVGLPAGAEILAPRKQTVEKPITFYGSSITQGGCASKPGACYSAILGRRLDAAIRNLGFSGNAKGEDTMIAHLAQLEMSVFVLDYDHNAPSPEHLMATHEKLFKAVRAAQPDLPVVMVTKPDFDNDAMAAVRRAIVKRTYDNAKAAGDDKVWFVDGETLFGETDRDLCTVDGCHPNTLGFLRMADGIEPAVREALKSIGL